MLFVGVPWFLTILISAQGMSPIWYILFGFVALVPYSYFYVLAYTSVQAKIGRRPGWQFYFWAVVVQFMVIGLLWISTAI